MAGSVGDASAVTVGRGALPIRWLPPLLVAAVAFGLARATLMPGVGFWDTAEFQTVGPVLGTAHPTGFPSYVILGWLASVVLQPFGDPAFRMNLLSAILVAVAVGATVVLQTQLQGRTFLSIAIGLVLATTPIVWSISNHADPHAMHLALLAIVLVLLVAWEDRRRAEIREAAHGAVATGGGARSGGWLSRADRWLLVAAFVYGVALADHTLALLAAPGIALFVLAVEPRILLRGRLVLACAGAVIVTTGLLYLELPIRAAMGAPLVYGRPDTLDGFRYIVLAEQFRGSLVDPFANLGTKLSSVVDLAAAQLGPLAPLVPIGFVATLVRRPRYALLSGVTLVITCWFSASYVNADINRYYLVPALIALTWVGVLAAAGVDLVHWVLRAAAQSGTTPGLAVRRWPLELLAAAVLLAPTLAVFSDRVATVDQSSNTSGQEWLDQAFGELAPNAVVVSWWSYSTPLWYGQRVLGRRPDIEIVDDRTRLDENLGEVTDVIDRELGHRPVYLIRSPDEIVTLARRYTLRDVQVWPGYSDMYEVVGRVGASS